MGLTQLGTRGQEILMIDKYGITSQKLRKLKTDTDTAYFLIDQHFRTCLLGYDAKDGIYEAYHQAWFALEILRLYVDDKFVESELDHKVASEGMLSDMLEKSEVDVETREDE